MNDLTNYFDNNTGNLIRKWEHYFDIYDRHFSRFRNKEVYIVEFGVLHGGSLQMWKHYFGHKAKIYGVDINPQCKSLEEEQIEILIGDQADRNFLESIKGIIPRIDILIDDGGHEMKQQVNTFEVLFPHIDVSGIYVCEDLQTSYFGSYGGGLLNKASFIEYSKSFIDSLHEWFYRKQSNQPVSDFTRSVNSLHYYTSVLVIEKKEVNEPRELKSGNSRVTPFVPEQKSLLSSLFNKFSGIISSFLR